MLPLIILRNRDEDTYNEVIKDENTNDELSDNNGITGEENPSADIWRDSGYIKLGKMIESIQRAI
jgi:hypothetical protein